MEAGALMLKNQRRSRSDTFAGGFGVADIAACSFPEPSMSRSEGTAREVWSCWSSKSKPSPCSDQGTRASRNAVGGCREESIAITVPLSLLLSIRRMALGETETCPSAELQKVTESRLMANTRPVSVSPFSNVIRSVAARLEESVHVCAMQGGKTITVNTRIISRARRNLSIATLLLLRLRTNRPAPEVSDDQDEMLFCNLVNFHRNI